jgi:hypothetical protein
MDKQQFERAQRRHQQAVRSALTVPPFRFSAAAVATSLRCDGLTQPLPGGMGARVRFEKA